MIFLDCGEEFGTKLCEELSVLWGKVLYCFRKLACDYIIEPARTHRLWQATSKFQTMLFFRVFLEKLNFGLCITFKMQHEAPS